MSIDLEQSCPECGSPMVATEGLDEGEAYCSQCDYREPFEAGWTDLDESYWTREVRRES